MEKIPLKLIDKRIILLNRDKINNEVEDLNYCLSEKTFMNNINFSKKVMFSHEIKNNNNIEGINDDLDFIKEVINEKKEIKDIERRNRIVNLYKGYKYILKHNNINKDSLRELYNILSDGLLTLSEKNEMGEYYRTRTGIILKKGRLDDSY